MNEINIKKSQINLILSNIVILIVLSLYNLFFVYNNDVIRDLVGFGLISLLILLNYHRFSILFGFKNIFVLLLILSGVIFNNLYLNEFTPFLYIRFINSLFLAVIISQLYINGFVFNIQPIMIGSYIIYRIYVMQLTPNQVFEETSTNTISIIFINLSALIYLNDFKNDNPIRVWPVLLTLIFSIIGLGRSGIFVSAFFFLAILYFKFKNKKTRLISFLTLILILVIGWKIFKGQIINYVSISKLSQGFDTPRWEMWRNYLDALNGVNFLFGIDLKNIPLINSFDGNPHNSFVLLLSYSGIAGVLLIILTICALFLLFKYNKFLFTVFVLIILRSFFDMVYFFRNYDFVFFAYLMFGLGKYLSPNQLILSNNR